MCRNLGSPLEGQIGAGQTTLCSRPGIQLQLEVKQQCRCVSLLSLPGCGIPFPSEVPRTHIPRAHRAHAATMPLRPPPNVPSKESTVPLLPSKPTPAVVFLSGCQILVPLSWRCLCLNQQREHFLPKPVVSEPITNAVVARERSQFCRWFTGPGVLNTLPNLKGHLSGGTSVTSLSVMSKLICWSKYCGQFPKVLSCLPLPQPAVGSLSDNFHSR